MQLLTVYEGILLPSTTDPELVMGFGWMEQLADQFGCVIILSAQSEPVLVSHTHYGCIEQCVALAACRLGRLAGTVCLFVWLTV